MKQEIYTDESPTVRIQQCDGPLNVRSRTEKLVQVRGNDAQIEDKAGEIVINSHGACDIYLPMKASLVIDEVHGQTVLKGINGQVTIDTVHGDLLLKNLWAVTMDTAQSNLIAKNINGPLKIAQINGDCAIRNVHDVEISQINGDFSAHNIAGECLIEHCTGDVGFKTVSDNVTVLRADRDVSLRNMGGLVQVYANGDIRLRDSLISGKHTLKADNDIVVRWPVDAPLLVDATGKEIQNNIPFEETSDVDGHFIGRIGDAQTRLILESEGSVILKSAGSGAWKEDEIPADFEIHLDFGHEMEMLGNHLSGMGEQIASEVTNRMSELSKRLESQFKALRKREEAVRQVSKRVYADPPIPPTPPRPVQPPPPPPAKAADNQAAQLKILEMLELGKISVEEANLLLKALE